MTFLETIQLIGANGEKVIHDRLHSIQTDKFLYRRSTSSDDRSVWTQKELPPIDDNQRADVSRFQPIVTTPPRMPKVKKAVDDED